VVYSSQWKAPPTEYGNTVVGLCVFFHMGGRLLSIDSCSTSTLFLIDVDWRPTSVAQLILNHEFYQLWIRRLTIFMWLKYLWRKLFAFGVCWANCCVAGGVCHCVRSGSVTARCKFTFFYWCISYFFLVGFCELCLIEKTCTDGVFRSISQSFAFCYTTQVFPKFSA
jgi:hypothetical protein